MLTINNTLDGYLKDVEILGNTIQDEEDLADIRSVGEKVEGQELYEIPVLSVGKNLSSVNEFTSVQTFKKIIDLKSLPNGNYKLSLNINNVTGLTGFRHYYKDGTFKLFADGQSSGYKTYNVEVSDTSDFIAVWGNSVLTNIQLEEGTVATPYEPYQEDKITILSPTPLEKVGDVRDRIIEKDGVWVVEKNVVDMVLNENSSIQQSQPDNQINALCDRFMTDEILLDGQTIFTDKLGYSNGSYDSEGLRAISTRVYIYIKKEGYGNVVGQYPNLSKFKTWLKDNNINIKIPSKNPQFIPLPHDQQVKLRTFANKTNISFLTEIEGTIKAQVPKSLGATVNTHTEQISNLNKELDRVKKLEESTVSTVETESDFTTVEATSNGYFEDVKLEGKTLVNHIDFATRISANNFAISGGVVTLTNNGSWGAVRLPIPATLKTNTKYTIILNILENTTGANFYYLDNNVTTSAFKSSAYLGTDSKGIITQLVETIDDFSGRNIGMRTDSDAGYVKFTYMLLEGDHTQNPPSGYIEGLKSVGQSTSEDGTDEIVVSSVKGDGNLFDGEIYKDSNKYWFIIRNVKNNSIYIDLGQTCSYFELYECGELSDCYIKYKDWKVIKTVSNQQATMTTVNKNHLIIAFDTNFFTSSEKLNKVIVNKGDAITSCKEYQSDKKRLLFYNEETQTWEKPILRQWDSIEKHSDGKYYYHQRSGEVVLNGSEDWKHFSDSWGTLFDAYILTNKKEGTTNLMTSTIPVFNFNSDETSFCCKSSENTIDKTRIFIKNPPNIQMKDVEGFKQWLQTNNVTVVYQLAEEKVYECTNIDLITYANETNYVVECGVIVPKSILKVHNNISNVVSLLQKKVSLLESNITKYMITQNRMQLASTYSADSVTFKVDYALCSEEVEYNEDLYNLILNNILVGKDNYDYDKMFTMILDYASWNQISWEQFDILVGLMDIQHNPPIEEIPTDDEIVEEIPNEIM